LALALSSAALADVSISSKPTQNMSCEAGVCTATAKKAVLNVGDLQTTLASGDVAVKTGTLAKDIEIVQPLTWATTSHLTLDAQQSVMVKKPVTVTGSGALTIAYKDGGAAGDLFFVNKGRIDFSDLNSSLVINGTAYALAPSIKTLAAAIAANGAGSYALAKDYDATNDGTYTASPIGATLSGTLEGLGHTIRKLTIAAQDAVNTGLLATIGSTGVVRDLALQSVRISSVSNKEADFPSSAALAGETTV